jgi:hypothetical protein
MGASLDPATGLFNWTPDEASGPGVYTATIRVTDNGSPALSDEADLTIIVTESNRPPVLVEIADRTANLGEVVTFAASATDPDLPAQLLTFELLEGAPTGASIDATNGVFTWTANTTGTNTVTIRVTDNSAPPLSDTKTFAIVVGTDLRISSMSLTNGTMAFGWASIPGRTYRVEFKDRLDAPAWTPLGNDIPASESALAVTDPIGTNTQRIYRIVLLP